MAFDPENAVPVEPFDPTDAVPERTDDELKKEWGRAGLIGRLKLIATDPQFREKFAAGMGKVGQSFLKNYDASVEQAFEPSATQPTIPRIEGAPDIPQLGAANPQVGAAVLNTAGGAVNSALTPGFASMINPLALAYALPHFAKKAGSTSAEFVGKLDDENASTQDVMEAAFNAALAIAGAVAPAHIALKGAKRAGPQATAPEAPPVIAAAKPSLASDFARYQEVNKQWRDLREKGVSPDSPEIQALWRENEQIKNRHEGMPPVEPVDIGPRDRATSTGEGVATAKEDAMMAAWKKQIADELGKTK